MTHTGIVQGFDFHTHTEARKRAVARLARDLRRNLTFQRGLGADGTSPSPIEVLDALDTRIQRAERELQRRALDALKQDVATTKPQKARPGRAPQETPAQRGATAAKGAGRPQASSGAAPTPTPAAASSPSPAPVPVPAPARPIAPKPARTQRPATGAASPYKVMNMVRGRTAPTSSDAPTPRDHTALDALKAEIGHCTRCGLCRTRNNIVFGKGSPNAKVMFIGDAPNYVEDKKGVPFNDKPGQLLDKMIVAMGLKPDDIYICNIVKCRPAGNRDPNLDELASCEPFLAKQLEAISPSIIVTLGASATRALTREDRPISQTRGQWRTYKGIKLMPTFHPKYVMRSPSHKRPVWEDLQKVMKALETDE